MNFFTFLSLERWTAVWRTPKSLTSFTLRPYVAVTLMPLLIYSSTLVYVEVAVGPFLEKHFGIDGNTSSYYFLIYFGIFTLFSMLMGSLVDRGHRGRLCFTSSFFTASGFLMLALPIWLPRWQNIVLFLLWRAFLGLFCDCPNHLEKIRVITASTSCVSGTLGGVIGPLFGGPSDFFYGYYY